MSAEISLEKLFEDQKKPAELPFVILPLDDEFIRMRPWIPTERCACGGGFVKVPRSAIHSVKTTGETQHCCGKTLQVVTVEFTEEPTLTYKDLFTEVRRSGRTISAPAVPSGRIPRVIKRPRFLTFTPVFPDDPSEDTGGGPGSSTGDPFEDCIRECIATARLLSEGLGTKTHQQWLQQVTALCENACYNYVTTGSPYGG